MKVGKNIAKDKYTKLQRKAFIVCAIVMVTYLVLAYFIMPHSFWIFGAIHTALTVGTIFFIWLGGAPKMITNIALLFSSVGAGTALMLILYYLTILSSLANG